MCNFINDFKHQLALRMQHQSFSSTSRDFTRANSVHLDINSLARLSAVLQNKTEFLQSFMDIYTHLSFLANFNCTRAWRTAILKEIARQQLGRMKQKWKPNTLPDF